MITIEIQESEAFDRLSILEIKKLHLPPLKQQDIQQQIEDLQHNISKNIGLSLSMEIYESPEYKHLFEVNKKLFLYVDKAKKNEVTAKDVDDEVYNRHLAKNSLQKRFFNDETKEVKIGYE
jgi:hypothetical protein